MFATTNQTFVRGQGFYVPDWSLEVTNRFFYALVDTTVGRLVDFVCFSDMATSLNVSRELSGTTQVVPVDGQAPVEPVNTWLTNRVRGLLDVRTPTLGVINQMDISLGQPGVSEQQWTSYSRTDPDGNDKPKAIDRFRLFMGETPLVYNTADAVRNLKSDLRGKLAFQAPYSPTRKLYQDISWQANDPLVHYMIEDLLDPQNLPNDPNRTNATRFAVPPQKQLTNSNLGLVNERYRPWGGNPNQSTDPIAKDLRYKDPMIARSDDWDFPTNKFPNIGWIGRVHRGTPWQTVYFKSGVAETNAWFRWSGSFGTHPTNDWNLAGLFTVAPNDNAARGLLGVNQTNLAAWSAVLTGVPVLTNLTPSRGAYTNVAGLYRELYIRPDGDFNTPQLRQIVAGISRTRSAETNGTFNSLGRILATPELTVASPFLNTNNLVNDAAMERIPQQILSLLKDDQPRFVVYAYGQALKEAPGSVFLAPGPFNQLCTNYQVHAEYATRTVIRVDGPITSPRAVVESFKELPAD